MSSESNPIYVTLFPATDTLYDLYGRRVCSPNLNKHHERAREFNRTAQQVSKQWVSFSKNAPALTLWLYYKTPQIPYHWQSLG